MILLDTELSCVGVDVNTKEYEEERKDKLAFIFNTRDKQINDKQKSDSN